MSNARITESTSDVPGCLAVVITSDSKKEAQDAIRLVRAWVKEIGGMSRLTSFTSAPRYSSNLDLFYRARIAYRMPVATVAA